MCYCDYALWIFTYESVYYAVLWHDKSFRSVHPISNSWTVLKQLHFFLRLNWRIEKSDLLRFADFFNMGFQEEKTRRMNVILTSGFGLFVYDVACIIVDIVLDCVDVEVDDEIGFFTKSNCAVVALDGIGFFVGFGLAGRDGNFSHCCVGFGFVIKFGCVVTCHWVVCAFWFHKPEINGDQIVIKEFWFKKKNQNDLPVDILDAVSKSGTVFSDKFGEVADVAVDCIWIGFFVEYAYVCECDVGRFWFDGRITSIPPPCGRWINVGPLKKKDTKHNYFRIATSAMRRKFTLFWRKKKYQKEKLSLPRLWSILWYIGCDYWWWPRLFNRWPKIKMLMILLRW